MKINIDPILKGKLDFLSSNYNFEVGGYLTGYVNEGQIYLDDLLIPNQSLSKTHVEITPQQQLELRQKYGIDKIKQVLGHWHSHNSMGCFWSQTDLNNMNNLSLNKEFFVFIVSSKGQHLVEVYLKKPVEYVIEDCKLNSYDQSIKEVELVVEELKKQNESFLKEEYLSKMADPDVLSKKTKQELLDETQEEFERKKTILEEEYENKIKEIEEEQEDEDDDDKDYEIKEHDKVDDDEEDNEDVNDDTQTKLRESIWG